MICKKCGEFITGFHPYMRTERCGSAFNPNLNAFDLTKGLWCEDCFDDFLTDCCEEAVACRECGKIEDFMYEDERDGEIIILCPDCAWKKGKFYLDNLPAEKKWEGYEE